MNQSLTLGPTAPSAGERVATEDVGRQIATMKGEIDALQTYVMRDEKRGVVKYLPNALTIAIALLSLALSWQVNQDSARRLTQQDQHAARAELRGLIQRLQALPKESFELNREYADDPATRSFIGGQIEAENIVLAQQAAQLIEQLDGLAGAEEYGQVAYGLFSAGLPAQAEPLLAKGRAVANNAFTWAGLVRQSAQVRYALGDIEGGRTDWQEALRVSERFPDEPASAVALSLSFTESSWATAELTVRNCPEASRHLDLSAQHAAGMAPPVWVDQTRDAIVQQCGTAAP